MDMTNILAAHPDLEEYISRPGIHTYKRYKVDGSLAEQWELKDGVWVDVSEIELAKEELIKATKAVEKEKERDRIKEIVSQAKLRGVPSHIHCPHCGSYNVSFNEGFTYKINKYVCEECRKRFSEPTIGECE